MIIKKIFDFKHFPLFWLIVFSFFSRVLVGYFYGDQNLENEWGTIIYNLENYRSFAFFKLDGQLVPSVYMPPMYPFLLYFLKIISFEKLNFVNLIIFTQIIFSTLSVYIFYKLNKKIFSNNLSLINSFIFSFFPLNLYTSGQISSINFQIFLSILFIQYLFSLTERQTRKNIIIFSITSGLLFLTRGEFVLIFLITIFYIALFKKVKLKNLFGIFLIVSLIISPYIIRNYLTFGKITIVNSMGYNLWKGNNQLSLVEGSGYRPRIYFDEPLKENDDETISVIKTKLRNIEINKYYEINRDKVFLSEAIKNLTEDPRRYSTLFLKKIFSYYFVDLKSNYPNYYNLFHFLPIFFVSVLSLPGIAVAFKKNNFKINYLLIYLLVNLVIFSIFFILPRYKLIILPIQIILTTVFIEHIYKKFLKRNQ